MEPCLVTDPELALDRMGEFKPDLIRMDLYMPNARASSCQRPSASSRIGPA